MKITVVIDENNFIVAYAILGGIEGGTEVEVDEMPNDLWTGYYKLVAGKLIKT